MRVLSLVAALGAAMFVAGASQSQAAPMGFDAKLNAAPVGPAIIQVQLQCDQFRCIDPRSGAYTQSGCDARGCYPISGVVGYTNPGGIGYGYDGRQRWRDWR